MARALSTICWPEGGPPTSMVMLGCCWVNGCSMAVQSSTSCWAPDWLNIWRRTGWRVTPPAGSAGAPVVVVGRVAAEQEALGTEAPHQVGDVPGRIVGRGVLSEVGPDVLRSRQVLGRLPVAGRGHRDVGDDEGRPLEATREASRAR